MRHRGYPGAEELLREQKVNGRGLLALVKDAKLVSKLGLHEFRALGLVADVHEYKRSGTVKWKLYSVCVFCAIALV